ncbi:MAG: carboxypeptidase-like regulatory domain-containing protein, partial [Caldiserica bacterium]|nr:carboxypeptidase-like regulatory domain-containing protein [Caldisericota bacterium]
MPKIQTGKVTVTAAESDGTAVKGATITLTNIDGTIFTATADPTGTAVFDAVAYGRYDVAAFMSGYTNGSDIIAVDSSGQDLSIAMESDSADSS